MVTVIEWFLFQSRLGDWLWSLLERTFGMVLVPVEDHPGEPISAITCVRVDASQITAGPPASQSV